MSSKRFAIGIDLGTTNCALAYLDLHRANSSPQILAIPQLEQLDRSMELPLLPSCLYYATAAEIGCGWSDPLDPEANPADVGVVVGMLARDRMAELPGRVVHSAKSWLSHAEVDREAQILPFASEEIPSELRLSPAEASASYLDYLKRAWDAKFARDDPGNAFVNQYIVITVPASFDEGAQALTRQAADLAAYPQGVRLFEEPQAAFYAWLGGEDQDTSGEHMLAAIAGMGKKAGTVLVCDIGGGTSDFSLFSVAAASKAGELPAIERIAISEHLLLGGDNIDLALAHLLEQRFLAERNEPLSRRQWFHLLPQACQLKERALREGDDGIPDEELRIALPGVGGNLFSGTLATAVSRRVIHELVLEGFYPFVDRGARPRQRSSGLREMGLPYAADSAISRHLAGFIDGRDVDAVLFVGGSLQPRLVRDRMLALIERWQGRRPTELTLGDMNLAVAYGAARYAALKAKGQVRIKGGYPRSVHLELRSEGVLPQLVCVLPQGFQEGHRVELSTPSFDLLVNQPVRFSAWTSHLRPLDAPGNMTELDPHAFHPLPPMFATIMVEGKATVGETAAQYVRVNIEATLTELGLMQLALEAQATGQRWQLEFNLRQPVAQAAALGVEKPDSASAERVPEAGTPPAAIAAAQARIDLFYGKKQNLGPKDNVKALPRDLERLLGAERKRWNLSVLRSLWPELHEGLTRRGRSLAHENTWLYLAGYFLRPGYGSDLDPWRMAQLWECFGHGLVHPREKSTQSAWWLMWRRTAGGLPAEQQEALFEAASPQFMQTPAEFVEGTRLLGSLERLAQAHKETLAERLLTHIRKGRADKQPHVFWALTRLLNREPLYTAADAVVSAAAVEAYFTALESLDWRTPALQGLVSVFTSACRRTGVRGLDIDEDIRARVVAKLREAGTRSDKIRVVVERCELSGADREELFGEELPAGLRTSTDGRVAECISAYPASM